jgi:phosphoribosyl 1,2-cyclic phosphodiesterase
VKLWGTRGSLPTPIEPSILQQNIHQLFLEFLKTARKKVPNPNDVEQFLRQQPRQRFGGYGGHTPCSEVKSNQTQLIIDGGSGIRSLGAEMMKGPCGHGNGTVHLFFTHFHWDHVMGLPFFAPIFIPGNQIHLYAVQPELPEIIQKVFSKPNFPVPLTQLGAQIHYHHLEPRKPFPLGDFVLTPYQLDHPDPCWGYRIVWGHKAYAHCVDTEGKRITPTELGPDLPLYQGIDTLVFDAQYTLIESIEKIDWGHASAHVGIDLAMREGIRRVIFIHFDPAASDQSIAAAEAQARRYYTNQIHRAQAALPHLHPTQWEFGYDGMVIEI